MCEARTLFRPHPQPLSHSVGEGCRGTRRCALQPFPLSRLRERLTSAILTSPHPYPLNNKTPIGYPYPYYGTT